MSICGGHDLTIPELSVANTHPGQWAQHVSDAVQSRTLERLWGSSIEHIRDQNRRNVSAGDANLTNYRNQCNDSERKSFAYKLESDR